MSAPANSARPSVLLGERREQVNLMLVGELPVGSWVLLVPGFAKEVLDDDYDPARCFADPDSLREDAR